ncbi:GhoT/OrtT family toxin [Escherichia albertii]|uniref:GhoT/OrtT family toxin n=1 Tax=Escherichia albertii TaxID=208962 RepID=UPI00074398E7|nr:GhoT/OrtT family toxin [Escherichia albertii]
MNILLLIYLLGVFFTSIVIFILSEETLLFRFFSAIIVGLTWPLGLFPAVISLMIHKSEQ